LEEIYARRMEQLGGAEADVEEPNSSGTMTAASTSDRSLWVKPKEASADVRLIVQPRVAMAIWSNVVIRWASAFGVRLPRRQLGVA
jgi:hypothetical protein